MILCALPEIARAHGVQENVFVDAEEPGDDLGFICESVLLRCNDVHHVRAHELACALMRKRGSHERLIQRNAGEDGLREGLCLLGGFAGDIGDKFAKQCGLPCEQLARGVALQVVGEKFLDVCLLLAAHDARSSGSRLFASCKKV